jgi:hypothetical protein
VRQTYLGGGKLFVDYAGDTMPVIVDRLAVEVREAQIFVTVVRVPSYHPLHRYLELESERARITFSGRRQAHAGQRHCNGARTRA